MLGIGHLSYDPIGVMGLHRLVTKKAITPINTFALFEQHYPSDVQYHDNNVDYPKLLHKLWYLPLVVAQVASYLQMNQTIRPTQYLVKLQ
jgi:hypothetical protein